MTAFRLHRRPKRKGERVITGTKMALYPYLIERTGGETASKLSNGKWRDRTPKDAQENTKLAAEAKRERRRARNLGVSV